MTIRFSAAIALAACLAGPVIAQNQTRPGERQRAERPDRAAMMSRLMERDADGDGALSRSELGRMGERLLERADANKDGILTRDELRAGGQNGDRNTQGNRQRFQGGRQGQAEGQAPRQGQDRRARPGGEQGQQRQAKPEGRNRANAERTPRADRERKNSGERIRRGQSRFGAEGERRQRPARQGETRQRPEGREGRPNRNMRPDQTEQRQFPQRRRPQQQETES